MLNTKKTKIIRKSFLNKKELIKYILDVDSNAEKYILELSDKAELARLQKQKRVEQISGLWYGNVAQKIRQITHPVNELKLNIKANWWYTQIDSDSRHQIGEQAQVDNKWYQVSYLAEAIRNCQFLDHLEILSLKIKHPRLKNHFDYLVQVLNGLINLKKIQIDAPDDTNTYYIEDENWTQKLKIKPTLKVKKYFS